MPDRKHLIEESGRLLLMINDTVSRLPHDDQDRESLLRNLMQFYVSVSLLVVEVSENRLVAHRTETLLALSDMVNIVRQVGIRNNGRLIRHSKISEMAARGVKEQVLCLKK